MTVDELRKAVDTLLHRAPKAEAIANVKTAREFKEAVKKAKTAKSKEKLESSFNLLKNYYP